VETKDVKVCWDVVKGKMCKRTPIGKCEKQVKRKEVTEKVVVKE
jgi:hypothetical protein